MYPYVRVHRRKSLMYITIRFCSYMVLHNRVRMSANLHIYIRKIKYMTVGSKKNEYTIDIMI